ncbi:MAG: ORF6N domain-containing protein [Sulfurimonas sp.]|nr:ORF6N domain-containing protein [Sulfurimonas sp.]MBU1216325.1 ORF6N domain-containing protein [bacterium]MBU1434631.1 ORF6N domain-containing protein [bacterium]MBU1502209.1 ORF6N domain-containing protein [bacterium]MBU4024575.1 ORF6N domain-containing protein [bacterium]
MNELSMQTNIENKIFTIRGMQVMLDRDLAKLYQVQTKVLNQAVSRNIERFPQEFMFQLTKDELENWKSQIVTSNQEIMGLRKMPFAFTEQGVSMLSAVLRSETAIKTSIQIINSFVKMRGFLSQNADIFKRLELVEKRQISHEIKADEKFEKLFDALEAKSIQPTQGIFYDGEVYDAYLFVSNLIKSAKKSIVLIDNYLDESVLTMLSKREKNVTATIYTKNITAQLELDIKKHNAQYPKITLKKFDASHDRFLIIDAKELYHIGASLKDLGKKWFAFSKFEMESFDILKRLEG